MVNNAFVRAGLGFAWAHSSGEQFTCTFVPKRCVVPTACSVIITMNPSYAHRYASRYSSSGACRPVMSALPTDFTRTPAAAVSSPLPSVIMYCFYTPLYMYLYGKRVMLTVRLLLRFLSRTSAATSARTPPPHQPCAFVCECMKHYLDY